MVLTNIQRERRSESQRKYYHNPANRHKDLARGAIADALRRGKIARRPCENCGSAKVEAHHADYSKPLDVHWLCRICHEAEHYKTHCVHGHELTAANIYMRPNGKRHCRQCRAEDMRRFRLARILGGSDST